MTTSDRVVALLIAVISVLIVVGFESVLPSTLHRHAQPVVDSRGEPFP